MEIVHRKIRVRGRVQGVWFRKNTLATAQRLGVKGFVRNEPDGSVYIEAESELSVLQEFIDWCKTGPTEAIVEAVNIETADPFGFRDFRIEY